METKNTVIITGLLMLIIGLGVGYTFKGSDALTGSRTGTHMMPDGSMMSRNIDQHFIVQMIPHHEGAIAMANTALERSKRPEIISLANGIIEAQTRENKDMRAWYESWFGTVVPEDTAGGYSMPSRKGMGGGMHMDSMEGDLEVLKSVSDAEFDLEFIDQMIPHHEMAIMMARMLAAATDRPEMEELADNIIASQSREIE